MTETGEAGTRARDLAPWRAVAGPILRGSVVIVAVAALAGGATLVLSSASDRARAETRLGLTDEVGWPFYDQVRDELSAAVDEPAVRDRVDAAVDGADYELRVEAPIDQSYLDVVAHAAEPSAAVAAADAAADVLVERSTGTTARTQEIQLESVDEELEVIDQRIADLRAAIAASYAETINLGEATDPGTSVRRQELQSERSTLDAELEELTRQQVQLDSEARQLRRELDSAQPEAQVVRRASVVGDDGRSFARPITAALVAGTVAALAAILLDRYRGRLRSGWYVEAAAGVDLLADLRSGEGGLGAPGELAARLDDVFLCGDDAVLRGRVVGLASVSPTLGSAPRTFVDALLAADHAARIAIPEPITGFEGEDVASSTTVVPIDHGLDRPEQHRRARSSTGLVIAVTSSDRVHELRRAATWARQLPAPLLGAVLLDDAPPVDAVPPGPDRVSDEATSVAPATRSR